MMQILIDTVLGMWQTHPVWTGILFGIIGLMGLAILVGICATEEKEGLAPQEEKQPKPIISVKKDVHKEFYPNSQSIRRKFYLVNGVKNGPEELYYHSGKINKQQYWDNGKLNGECVIYYPSGHEYMRSSYKQGILENEKRFFSFYAENLFTPTPLVEGNIKLPELEKEYCANFSKYQQCSKIEKSSGFLGKVKRLGKVAIGVQGWKDRKQAKNIEETCRIVYKNAQQITLIRRKEMQTGISRLGSQRLKIFKNIVGKFLGYLQDLDQKNKEKTYEILSKVDLNKETFKEMEKVNKLIGTMKDIDMSSGEIANTTLLMGTAGSIAAAATPTAVTGAVGALATASTGTAISSLSGVAATNATLAWLGGGSLASGGGGMAAGAATLSAITGGAFVGVALITAGITASSYYSNKLTKIVENSSKAVSTIKDMEKCWPLVDGVVQRVNELIDITNKMEERTLKVFNHFIPRVPDFDMDNAENIKVFQQTALLVKALIDLINTPLLDEKGDISSAGLNVITSSKKILKNKELVIYE
ncbi:toxin-antitoxin system YwqK family antitoxin [Candidatus Avelusimicrobium fimicolum]|uniref:toxin-antitoxin system YwqK family antitoxin n=1 Tax=Candidatus Avelusimicrobium TaxID=2840538 RepID=UPI003D152F03